MASHNTVFAYVIIMTGALWCVHGYSTGSDNNNINISNNTYNYNLQFSSRNPNSNRADPSTHFSTTLPPLSTSSTMTSETGSEEEEQVEDDDVTEGQKIAVMAMLVLFSVFGTFGNGLVLYVFTRKNDKATSTIFILALAWTDFFTCLLIIPFTVAFVHLKGFFKIDLVCKLYYFVSTCNVPLSAFIMVTIAVDRYFSICHPFLHAVTPRRARIAICCLCLFAFSLGTITACSFGVYQLVPTTISGYWDTTHQVCRNETLDTPTSTRLANVSMSSWYDHFSVDQAGSSSETMEILVGAGNSTGQFGYGRSCNRTEWGLQYTGGECQLNTIIFSIGFVLVYQKIYISFFIISLLSVFTLYFFIYRSVVRRRAWRKKQKSWSHSPMTMTAGPERDRTARSVKQSAHETKQGENVEMIPKSSGNGNKGDKQVSPATTTTTAITPEPNATADQDSKPDGANNAVHNAAENDPGASKDNGVNSHQDNNADESASKAFLKSPNTLRNPIVNFSKQSDHQENGELSGYPTAADKKTSRERRDFNFLANIRTAIMLFVVAVVFIVSFLPAWLMATEILTYQVVIFYMHFVYNASNPVIYAFMNQSFRKELKRVFQRGTHFLRSG